MFRFRVSQTRALALGCAALAICASSVLAQVTLRQIARPGYSERPSAPATSLSRGTERVPEGTEVKVRLEDQLSSATAVAGDTFSISTDEAIRLPDGTVIPAGFRGKGEVTEAHKKEMLGKAGELSVRLDYIRIGDVRLHLRATKAGEGRGTLTTTVVLTVLLTPLFLMHHGHEMVFPRGSRITAYVDDDAVIALPVAPPPQVD